MMESINSTAKYTGMEVAVIGMAGRFPGAKDIEQFWENLKNGKESIKFLSKEELSEAGVSEEITANPDFVNTQGAICDDIEYFDAHFFNYLPREAELMDPQTRFLHECTWEALENAGWDPDRCEGLIGLYAGASNNFFWMANSFISGVSNELGQFESSLLINKDFLCTRVAFKLNLKGPAVAIQTACSTSLAAVHTACQALSNGECDIALAGGAALYSHKNMGYIYQEGMIFSPDGHCRTFDAEAKGTIFGEGVGIVVLKPLEDAISDRDFIHAVIKGTALNNDGIRKGTYTSPSREGQTEVIRLAHQVAEIDPTTITYVEAHGTGTPLGDPIEIEALKQAFNTEKRRFCGIGSVKTNVGHLDVAAGIAGLIKTILAMKHKLLPPSLHFKTPNPKIDFENSPFYVVSEAKEWQNNNGNQLLRAGVSSFGFGGTNAHIILEEWPDHHSSNAGRGAIMAESPLKSAGPEDGTVSRGDETQIPAYRVRDKKNNTAQYHKDHLILLSAKTPTALDKMTGNLVHYFKKNPGINLADAVYTLQVGRQALEYRKMVIASNAVEAIDILSSPNSPKVQTFHAKIKKPPVIMMFPGQGSQYVDMGLDLYRSQPVFHDETDRCFEILTPLIGNDIKKVLYPSQVPPDSPVAKDIDQTRLAQPTIFILSYALVKLLEQWGIRPYAMIGHSIGEYVAAHLSGVFSLEDALRIVTLRGQLMQEMPRGAMTSVSLPENELKPLLKESEGISLAAVNGPALCVVSGPPKQIATFESQLRQKGCEYQRLHTSHAFHSPMMEPILEPFREAIKQIPLNRPQIPFMSNLTGKWITVTEATDPRYWTNHLRKTVRFADGLEELLKIENALFLEAGPGKALSTFVRQHPHTKPGQTALNLIRHPKEHVTDHRYLSSQLGQLWLFGAEIDWHGFYLEEKRYRLPLPTYPFERQRFWIENNMLKPDSWNVPGELLKNKAGIADWFYVPSWKRAPLVEPASEEPRNWLVLANETDICSLLVKRLKETKAVREICLVKPGDRFEKLESGMYTINPLAAGDYDALLTVLAGTHVPDCILHLWNINEAKGNHNHADRLMKEAVQRDHDIDVSFFSIFYLAQSLGRQHFTHSIEITTITNNLQDVTGEEELYPYTATVLGLLGVVPREYDNINCRGIDVVFPSPTSPKYQRLLDHLIAELNTNGNGDSIDRVIAYRGNHRLIPSVEAVKLENRTPAALPLREKGVYLVTGGLGGIGLALAKYLAEKIKARLILVGRSHFPGRDQWETWLDLHPGENRVSRQIREIQEIEALGAQVKVLPGDTADIERMREIVRTAEACWGKINGIIHSAGVAGDGVIQRKDTATALQVLAPKVKGTLVLDTIFKDYQLDFWVLCSSLATVLHQFGQVDYCSANTFQDAFANYKSRQGSFVVSINWDTWQEKGMAVDAFKKSFTGPEAAKELFKYAIKPGEGVKAFERILALGLPQVLVSTVNLPYRIRLNQTDQWKNKDKWSTREHSPSLVKSQRQKLSTPYAAPRNLLEHKLAEIWQEFFRLKEIGIHDNFFELGGDSLKGITLVNRYKELLDETVYSQTVFEAPTIAELAAFFTEHYSRAVAAVIGDDTGDESDLYPRKKVDNARLATIRQLISFQHPRDERDSSLPKNPPAIFILSPPRSGSTLLRVMLGGHPRLFAPPELSLLSRNTFGDTTDTWDGVTRAIMQIKQCSVEEAKGIIKKFEDQKMSTRECFRQLQEWLDGKILVDKSPLYTNNLDTLKRAEEIFENPWYIHLVRHPYGTIRSKEEANLNLVPGAFKDLSVSRYEMGELEWLICQQNILEFFKQVPANRQYRVKFEELVKEPRTVIQGICRFLGLEFDPEMLQPYKDKKKRMTDGIYAQGIMIGDPKFHDHQTIDPRVADTWKTYFKKDFLSDITWETAKIFRYERSGKQEYKFTGINAVEKKEYYPLSSAQKRIYLVHQMEPRSTIYNLPQIVKLEGNFHRHRLKEVFQKLIQRHEALRTTFEPVNHEPRQRIHPLPDFNVEYIDLTADSAANTTEKNILENFIKPFDLSRLLLIRPALIKTREEHHLLIIDIHHIITDGVTQRLIIKEIMDFYMGETLPALKIHYRDYSQWQNIEKKTGKMKQQEAFWLKQFAGEIPVLNLPVDFPRNTLQTNKGKTIMVEIDKEQINALNRIAIEQSATLFMILLAIFNVFLAKLSNQEDIVVGVPTAGREQKGLWQVIGMFVNTVPVRNYPTAKKTFREFLQDLRVRVADTFENQAYQFEDLVEKLNVRRVIGRNPLFDALFGLQNFGSDAEEAPGLQTTGVNAKPYPYRNRAAKFDLSLMGIKTGDTFLIAFEYKTNLFKITTILKYRDYLKRILALVLKDPDQQLAEMEIISREEKKQILYDFNDTEAHYPKDKLLHQLFEEQVKRNPDRTAVIVGTKCRFIASASREQTIHITYHQLNRQSHHLALLLIEKGVKNDSIVGIKTGRSIEMLVGIMAILKAGGAYLPIDPGYPEERINYMLKDSGAQILLTDSANGMTYEKSIVSIPDAINRHFVPTMTHLPPIPATSLAYVIYTSGSTGKPKGVMVEHLSVLNLLFVLHQEYPLTEKDIYLLKTPYIFDVSVTELFGWFLQGGRLAILEKDGEKDPGKILDAIENLGITHINFVPSMFNAFLEALNAINTSNLSSLKHIFLAGEAVSPGLVERFAGLNTAIALENLYGPTEGTVYASKYSLCHWNRTVSSNIPIGKPIQNVRLYILDKGNHMQPQGVPGELIIGGIGVARGYLNQPELTAEKFDHDELRKINKKFLQGSRGQFLQKAPPGRRRQKLYKTGDLARWLPDGNIEFLGRKDFQVKVRGFRIELGEIEHRLQSHKQIKEAVVTIDQEENGDNYLCAYYVCFDPLDLSPSQLRDYLIQHLPSYMVPGYFVPLEKMPLTTSGKVDRKALPKKVLPGSKPVVAPRNTIEKKIMEIWQEVLLQPTQHQVSLGIDSNFFEVGGHSLKAAIMVSKIHKELQVKVPFSEVFKRQTVRELSRYIKNAEENKYTGIEPVEKKEYYVLSSAQKRIYFLQEMDRKSIAYNMPFILPLGKNIEIPRIETAMKKLIMRHESLRTTFHIIKGEAVQCIHDNVEFKLKITDALTQGNRSGLTGEPRAQLNPFDGNGGIENVSKPFDLSQAPLFRSEVIKLPSGHHTWLVAIHHIVSDGISQIILMEDFMSFYQGKELASLRIQYKDFSKWQNRLFAGGEIQAQENYWLNLFHDAREIPRLQLPYDYNRPEVFSYAGDVYSFEMDRENAEKFNALATRHSGTLYMNILAVMNALLYKYTGETDILIGSGIAARSHQDLQDIVGMFINTLVMRNYPEGEKEYESFLKEVIHQAAKAFENQDVQFEALVDKLEIERDISRNPLFDISLVVQNFRRDRQRDETKLTMEEEDHPVMNYKNTRALTDMTFYINDSPEHIHVSIEYYTGIFKEDTIKRLALHFQNIIKTIIREPSIKLKDIDITSREEREEILHEFNRTAGQYPGHKTIHELFAERAAASPDRIAAADRHRMMSYSQLNEKANRLALHLKKRGVKRDSRVAIMGDKSLEIIFGILGIMKAGGGYLPVDPDTPEERLKTILTDSSVSVLLIKDHMLENYSFVALQEFKTGKAQITMTPRRPQIKDLDNLPVPDRSLIDYGKYSHGIGAAMARHTMAFQFTRGCPYKCAYCHKIWPKAHVVRSAKHIFAEVKTLYDLGVQRFTILDDIFNLDQKNSREFYELLIKHNLKIQMFFPNGMRGDILTSDYIDLLVEAGVATLALALETASPRLQKLIRKNLNIDKLYKNIDYICTKYPNVISELFTMHGFPTETEEEAMKTMDFYRSLRWLHFPHINILKVFPDTEMAELCIENGISADAIARSENRAYHELPETLPFDKLFTIQYQSLHLEYLLNKERLLHILPYQMKILTESELVEKYNSGLATEINELEDLLKLAGITREELGVLDSFNEKDVYVPDIHQRMLAHFAKPAPHEDALKVLLLDLSQFFSGTQEMLYDVSEPPLGLMYLMTYLQHQYGRKINGKVAKSRTDFDSYGELKNMVEEFKPDVIGVRSLTFYRRFFHRTIALLRQWGLDIPIIAGGPYATSEHKRLLQDRNVDLVVLGEGEVTLARLIGEIMENNRQLPPEDVLNQIEGLAFISNNEKAKNPYRGDIIMLDAPINPAPGSKNENPVHINQPQDLAYAIFTSGSTGNPKGVMIQHASVINFVYAMYKNYSGNIGPADHCLSLTATSFDVSAFEIFVPLLLGARIVVLPNERLFDPEALARTIVKEAITLTYIPPNLLKDVYQHLKMIAAGSTLELNKILVGVEPIEDQVLEKYLSLNPSLQIVNGYGPTEATICATAHRYQSHQPEGKRVPIGGPLTNNQVLILDKSNHLAPIGIPGELCIAGHGLSRGYINNPELTAEKFILTAKTRQWTRGELITHHSDSSLPHSTTQPLNHSPLYKTGDQAKWLADGNILFIGRIDQQVKIRGFRIELGEIESHLLKHEAVREVVVMARRQKDTGTQSAAAKQLYLCAYIAAKKEWSASQLKEYLAQKLPDYMIPPVFVPIEKIPLTPAGKVNRKALPGPGEKISGNNYQAPGNEVETILAEIWTEILLGGSAQAGDKTISINDNFFEIGGDSIKTIQVVARMKKSGYKLDVQDIFQEPRIATLAPLVKKIEQAADRSIVTGTVPLTPIQTYFFESNVQNNHHFNQAVMLFSKEGFEKDIVKDVFSKIQEHHDALRMTYKEIDGEIVQTGNGPGHPLSLEVYDLRSHQDAKDTLKSKANRIQANINLETGPLMKLGLFHLDDGDYLLIAIHHLVIDGVSWRILFEDIETLYHQYKKGEKPGLPSKTTSFKSWAEKLKQYSRDEIMLKEKSYWASLNARELPKIEKDFDVEKNILKDVAALSFKLNREQSKQLLTTVNRAFGTEINDILLTALALAVKETREHRELLIALEGHGREGILEDTDISRTVGWFTAIYPVLLKVSHEGNLARQIKEIKENLHRIPNKGIGYGILKYLTPAELKKDIQLEVQPQVSFNYLGQFDTDVDTLSFSVTNELVGNPISPETRREYELEVSGMMANQQLTMSVTYNPNQYKQETIETLVNAYKEKLQDIISFCSARQEREFTPSDFTYTGLTVEMVDRLSRQYPLEDIYRLTPMQEGMLFHSLYTPDSSAYFQQISYRWRGKLKLALIEKSVQQLSKRHEILRTAFVHQHLHRPIQVVLKERPVEIHYQDLSKDNNGSPEANKEFIDQFKEQDRKRSFDLEKDILIRVSIFRTGEETYEFTWSFHHILMDAWCIGILHWEFLGTYTAHRENRSFQLPETIPHKRYIQWLEKQDKEASARYWQNYLDAFEEHTGIPRIGLSKRAGNSEYRKERFPLVLDRQKTARLAEMAAGYHTTLNTITRVLWGILLAKYIDKEDVVFGAVVSGRPSELEGMEAIVGLFINTIPVRTRYRKEMTFSALLESARQDAIASEPHHYHPLAEIQNLSPLKQNLIDHLFVFENYPMAEQIEGYGKENTIANASAVKIDNVEVFEQTNYDFNLLLSASDQLNIQFQYNANVYDGQEVEEIARRFALLADQVIDNKEVQINKLTLLAEEEKNRLLVEFNRTQKEYPENKTIHQLFAEQAKKGPDHTAVLAPFIVGTRFIASDSRKWPQHITYKQLNETSDQLAHLLREKGVRPGTIAGIMVERSIEIEIGILAILKAGGAYMPIDPEYPEERINYMLKDSGARVLLVDSENGITHEKSIVSIPDAINRVPALTDPAADIRPANPAYIIYTSGSTGQPKGVIIEHGSVVNTLFTLSERYPFSNRDVYLVKTSYLFDVSVTEILGFLFGGGKLVMLEKGGEKDPQKILDAIERENVSHINFVPSMFKAFADFLSPPNITGLASLKYIFLAGEALYPDMINRFKEQTKNNHILLENIYGPTEAAIYSSAYSLADWNGGSKIPIGKPLNNTALYVLDKQSRLQPIGIQGELCIAGAGLARGYLNNPQLTAEKFGHDLWDYQDYHDELRKINKKFLQGSRGQFLQKAPPGRRRQKLYKTGDLARWLPDGNIQFLGRIDHQVKIRGYRIELAEIESRLLDHQHIKDAVAVEREDKNSDKYICVYFVTHGSGVFDNKTASEASTQLREYLSQSLPDYMIPAYFIKIDKILQSASGKVDRAALPEPAAGFTGIADTCVPPTNHIEEALVRVWQEVLDVYPIGTTDNFFKLGGDSIKAIQVSVGLKKYNLDLKMNDLFSHPFIKKLAGCVKKTERIIFQGTVEGEVALTPIQHWFFKNDLNGDTLHHFNQAVMLYSRDGFEPEAITAVFKKITEHHDALRLTFRQENGRFMQINQDLNHPLSLAVYDLKDSKNAPGKLEDKINEIQTSMDLQTGPLMKLGLFHLQDGDRLAIVCHHLVIDGVSWRILFEDIETLYRQYKQGKKLELPLKTDSFKTWVEKLADYADSELFFKEKPYWTQLAATILPVIKKDFEVNGDSNYVKDTASLSFSLDEEETKMLLTKVNEPFSTEINDILLTALGLAIKKTYNHERIAIALEGHGREEIFKDIDIHRTVGWFTSLYPVILNIAYEDNLARQIKEIKECLRRVPNKGTGYGILKYLTSLENKDGLEFNLKPQVSFNYLGQFDADIEQKSFTIAEESPGNTVAPDRQRQYEFDVSGLILAKKLRMSVVYGKKRFKPETVERLLEHFKAALLQIIDYCRQREERELTPADLTCKELTIDDLDRVYATYDKQKKGKIKDIYRLSPMQEGMFFHSLVDPSSPAYFEQISYRLEGNLNISYMERSLHQLLERHDILRTAFDFDLQDRPIQIVLNERKAEFYYEDIRALAGEQEKNLAIENFKQKDKQRCFDLSNDVLMRLSILQPGTREYEFAWSFHHILMDGWCIGIVAAEFFMIYQAYVEGKACQLPKAEPYKTYIRWLGEQDIAVSKGYWKNRLAHFDDATGIPGCHVHTKSKIERKHKHTVFQLEKEATIGLKDLAVRNKATLNTLVQTVWGILLGKYSGKEDVVFGAVVSGRPAGIEGVESMIGLFINNIPVRITWNKDTAFNRLLKKVQQEAIDSEPHHYYPLAEIQAESILKRNLLDHILIFENYPVARQMDQVFNQQETGGKNTLTLSNIQAFEQTNYDFNVLVNPHEQLTITLDYNENVYDSDFVGNIFNHLDQLFQQILKNEALTIGTLTILSEEEKSRLLYEWNDTQTRYPTGKTIHQLFVEQVRRIPDNIAVVAPMQIKNRTYMTYMTYISYWELNEKSNQLAHLLTGKGVQPSTIVGILAVPSVEMIIAILGILKAGGAYLPIDPDYPEERIKYIMKDSAASILLTHKDITPSPSTLTSTLTFQVSPTNLAYIIYTSGTTGKPKGVAIEHKNVVRLLFNDKFQFDFNDKDIWTMFHSYCFDFSVWEMYGALLYGGNLLVIPRMVARNPELYYRLLKTWQVTVVNQTPAAFYNLAQEALSDPGTELAARYVIFGGDALNPRRLKEFQAKYPRAKLINMFGITETTVHVTYKEITHREIEFNLSNIGKPIPTLSTYVVDRNWEPVPPGVPGELIVGVDGVSRGYLNQPGLTAEKFVTNPYKPGERCYCSGDLVRALAGGDLEYLGRIDQQIQVRGYRVEPAEIENPLLSHHQIKEAAVLLKVDQTGRKNLCAYIAALTRLTAAYLREYLADQLPDYMIPSYFIQVEKIPLTANGKIDSRRLPEPSTRGMDTGRKYAAPKDELEELLARVWEEVLQISAIGVNDKFFDLGGTSLDVMTVNRKLRKTLGRDIPVVDHFTYPTIAEFARCLEQQPQPPRPSDPGTEENKPAIAMEQENDRQEELRRGKQYRNQRFHKRRSTRNEP